MKRPSVVVKKRKQAFFIAMLFCSQQVYSQNNPQPCVPDVTVENICNGGSSMQPDPPYENTIRWNLPGSCNATNAPVQYRLWYSATTGDALAPLALIDGAENTFYVHSIAAGVAGCYAVSSIDALGNESPVSAPFCVTNCPHYELPNTFSPNGDGSNDTFVPLPGWRFIGSVDMQVYNQWGDLVYATTDPAINWDGKWSGSDLPEATYFYVCKVYEGASDSDLLEELRGYIQLTRTVQDNQPPCVPTLTVENFCMDSIESQPAPPYENTLRWTNPVSTCSETNDAVEYRLWYAPTESAALAPLTTIAGAANTFYIHSIQDDVAGCYAVSAIDAAGNESAFSTKICVDNCPQYTLPIQFSPNGDGVNDYFTPNPGWRFIERVETAIYNRWGNQVFSTTDPAINWDGKWNGDDLPEGTYFYVCEVFERGVNGVASSSKQLNGYITMTKSVVDNMAPCVPSLAIENICTGGSATLPDPPYENTLRWTNPNVTCADTDDARRYRLWYAATASEILTPLELIDGAATTSFVHTIPNGLTGCYAISAIDASGNESPLSPKQCVNDCPAYDLPSSFSPNGDGVDDVFTPLPGWRFVDKVELKIFNSAFDLIFETTDPAINWDGSGPHGPHPEEAYYYACDVIKKGTDSLLLKRLFGLFQLVRTAADTDPPCAPGLTVENFCNSGRGAAPDPPYENRLNWTNPNIVCSDTADVVQYRLWYATDITETVSPLATIDGAENTSFVHEIANRVAGCYSVTAIDASGNESPLNALHCVDNCPEYSLPNAFSPNGDGTDDIFTPLPGWRFIKTAEAKIFNRWGQLVFETTNPAINWDGNLSGGAAAPEGSYFIVCTISEDRLDALAHPAFEIKGHLVLSRPSLDTTPPVIADCPRGKTVSTDTSQCTAVVSWIPPTATDDFGTPDFVSTHEPGDAFPVGITEVAYTAIDAARNMTNCVFSITVEDKELPIITCSEDILAETDTVVCWWRAVDFESTASDNCDDDVYIAYTQAPGSGFPVGVSPVICTAFDEAGNVSHCTFTVTVQYTKKPRITCPANQIQSCEIAVTPDITGIPTTQTSCTALSLTSTDEVVIGDCPGRIELTRTWVALDRHGNSASCEQVISVEDKIAPRLNCPANDTVDCHIRDGMQPGVTIAQDNCDPNPSLTSTDAVVAGNCDLLCTIERTWLTADACGNTATCVQIIVKDKAPILERALEKDLDGDGLTDTLVLGTSRSTLTIPPGSAECIQKWFPGTGTRPTGLKFKQFTVGANCTPGTNPVDANGQLTSPLLAEALKLNLQVRLNPDLGTTKLSTLGCTVAPIVLQALAPNPDINELLRVTNAALGNVALQPHLGDLLEALSCINAPLEFCE